MLTSYKISKALLKVFTILITISFFTSLNASAGLDEWIGFNALPSDLGTGQSANILSPVDMDNLTDAKHVYAGNGHSLVLKNDNTLWAVGSNQNGQLGQGYTSTFGTLGYTGLNNMVHSSPGVGFSLGLKIDGTVWSWGASLNSRLGYPVAGLGDQLTPTMIPGLTGIVDVEAGSDFGIALKNDGTVWTWGNNVDGRLGNGSYTEGATPTQVPGITTATDIEANRDAIAILLANGTVRTAGSNTPFKSLGNDSTMGDSPNLVNVVNVSNAVKLAQVSSSGTGFGAIGNGGIAYGWGHFSNFNLNLLSDQTVNCSGTNGVTGYGCQFNLLPPITDFAGDIHTQLFLTTTGDVLVNGNGSSGQAGDGSIYTPDELPSIINTTANIGGAPVTEVDISVWGLMARRSNGTVAVWGRNENNQLGNNNNPRKINNDPKSTAFGDDYLQVLDYVALRDDGTVWTWGVDGDGQLGDGTITPNLFQNTPIQVPGLTGITQIATMNQTRFALDSSGDVWSWGHNVGGNLATGSTSDPSSPTPTLATGMPTNIREIKDGCALTTTNELWCWGLNGGVFDNGTNSSSAVPILSETNVLDIERRWVYSAYILKTDGTVWSVGTPVQGSLGYAATAPVYNWTQVSGLSNIVDINTRSAVNNAGQVFTWGIGAIGDGTDIGSETPVPITFPEPIQSVQLVYAVGQSGDVYRYTTADSLVPTKILGVSNATNQDSSAALEDSIFFADLINSLQTIDIPLLNISCTTATALTTTSCTFPLPVNTRVGDEFALGIGNATPGGSCTDNGVTATCLGVPVGSFIGAGTSQSQDIFGVVGIDTPVDSGENVTILSPGGDEDSDGLNNNAEFINGSNPTNPDTDGDTLSDGFEVNESETDPSDANSDSSATTIVDEGANSITDCNEDLDNDGLTNCEEQTIGTDPNNFDTDGDGLPDGFEVDNNLDPLDDTGDNGENGDPDGDGLDNAGEFLIGHSPVDPDSDSLITTTANENDNTINDCNEDIDADGATNCEEYNNGTDPIFPDFDTDGDGVPDFWENLYGLDPNNPNDAGLDPDADFVTNLNEYILGTLPNDPDSDSVRTALVNENDNTISDCNEDFDGDGLINCDEFVAGTDPFDGDSDGDGLPDGFEVDNGLDPNDESDADGDPDGDGLTNKEEYENDSDPNSSDTDGDGLPDGFEVDNGLDPNDATGDNGADGDPDGDGLLNKDEFNLGLIPSDSDSDSNQTTTNENDNGKNDCDEDIDGDGATNCAEIAAGTDPKDPNSKPNVNIATNLPRTGGIVAAGLLLSSIGIVSVGLLSQKRKEAKVKIR